MGRAESSSVVNCTTICLLLASTEANIVLRMEIAQMKAFTIDADNNISFFESKSEATESLSGREGAVFTTKDQLAQATANATIPALVEIFNSFSGVVLVKKFASKAIGVTRIWNECQKMAGETTEETPNTGEQAAPVAPVVKERKVRTPKAPKAVKAPKPAKEPKAPKVRKPKTEGEAKAPREGSKTAKVIEMLKREGGATLTEIMKKFGWQSHTARAMMSAGGSLTRKHGITVQSDKGSDGDRVYRIAS